MSRAMQGGSPSVPEHAYASWSLQLSYTKSIVAHNTHWHSISVVNRIHAIAVPLSNYPCVSSVYFQEGQHVRDAIDLCVIVC